jgi:hypothetical protein
LFIKVKTHNIVLFFFHFKKTRNLAGFKRPHNLSAYKKNYIKIKGSQLK